MRECVFIPVLSEGSDAFQRAAGAVLALQREDDLSLEAVFFSVIQVLQSQLVRTALHVKHLLKEREIKRETVSVHQPSAVTGGWKQQVVQFDRKFQELQAEKMQIVLFFFLLLFLFCQSSFAALPLLPSLFWNCAPIPL